MKLSGPQATILAAIIAVLGIALGAFLNPLAEKIVNRPGPTPGPVSMAIEEFPQQVFAYAGNDNPDGGGSTLLLLYDEGGLPIYELDYSLPADKHGYAGLAFEFVEGLNLSAYEAVECVILFSQLSDEVDLYFKDIAGSFDTIRVANNGADEMALRYELTNFPKVNFNAVKEFGIVISTDFSSGLHQVRIKDVRLTR